MTFDFGLRVILFLFAHWVFLWVCSSVQLPPWGGLQMALRPGSPRPHLSQEASKPFLGRTEEAEEGRKQTEDVDTCLLSVSMTLILIREISKGSEVCFPWHLKCGIAPPGPRVRDRESDARAG